MCWINRYPEIHVNVNKTNPAIGWIVISAVDSIISFEQPRLGFCNPKLLQTKMQMQCSYMYVTLTFVSHWQRSPFSCPVIMYWSNGPQRAAVTLGPSIGTVRKGSLDPSYKQGVTSN